MKVKIFLTGTLSILLAVNLLLWAAAHGSGHNIPYKTDLSFAVSSLILGLALSILHLRKNIR
jgi:hypothetical protein